MRSAAPAVGVSALDAAAHVIAATDDVGAGDVVAVWLDARRGEVFTALYEVTAAHGVDGRLREVDGPAVGAPDHTAGRCISMAPPGRRLHLVTDAADAAIVPAVTGRFANQVLVGPRPRLAAAIAEIGADWASRGLAGPPHGLQPLYIRRPDAELARERRAARLADEGHQA